MTLGGALLFRIVFNILNFENGLGFISLPLTGSSSSKAVSFWSLFSFRPDW